MAVHRVPQDGSVRATTHARRTRDFFCSAGVHYLIHTNAHHATTRPLGPYFAHVHATSAFSAVTLPGGGGGKNRFQRYSLVFMSTVRMRKLPVSATNSVVPTMARPRGHRNRAESQAPSAKPALPVPQNTDTAPGCTMRERDTCEQNHTPLEGTKRRPLRVQHSCTVPHNVVATHGASARECAWHRIPFHFLLRKCSFRGKNPNTQQLCSAYRW